MSRRSSYGYGSYRSGSYGYGGYRRNRRGGGGKKKIIIAAVCTLVAAGAAVGVCAYIGVFGNKNIDTAVEEKSTVSAQSSVKESSVSAEKSKKPEESSKAESSKPVKELKGEFDGNVFIYDKQGYEIFYGTEDTAKKYVEAVSKIRSSLDSSINVYDMVVPTHSEYGLPDKYKKLGSDEKENIKYIYSQIGDNVKTIDANSGLESHKDEYIYFKTDNNWTGLGAYYSYAEFCKAAGMEAVDISKLSSGEIKGFTGSLASATKSDEKPDGNKILYGNPDFVKYYTIPGNYTCTLLENGKDSPEEVPLIATIASGSNAYSAFIWGDNPYMHIKTNNNTGRKLCIIKDSLGCAFAPFTVSNFDEIYIIDPNYYEGNILDFIKKNKYTDVLLINSIMKANTQSWIDVLHTVL